MQRRAINVAAVDAAILREAASVLAAGGVVAFPTETAYGLAADPASASAVEKIYAMKGREKGKPLPLIAASRADAEAVALLSPAMQALADAHWPGPLTLVAPLRPERAAQFAHVLHDGTVAVRVSPAPWPQALAAAAGGVVTATSANLSGRPTLYDGARVAQEFSAGLAAPDMVLDAGALPESPPSTIVAEKDGGLVVVRQGTVRIQP